MAETNPFPDDPDRREIWTMLVARDIEAFTSGRWSLVEPDFIAEGFLGLDARGQSSPDAWSLAFGSLTAHRDDWLQQSRRFTARTMDPAQTLASATTLRDIDISGDAAVAHKKVDGVAVLRGGGSAAMDYQTLYFCRRITDGWRVQGFVAGLPVSNPPSAGRTLLNAKSLPSGAGQHSTAGPYSPVLIVSSGQFVVISGQAAILPDGRVEGGGIGEQTRLTLANCRQQLASAGCALDDVFKVNVFLTDLRDWGAFNEIYRTVMPEPRPVRTAVGVSLLPGLLVEVEMWATRQQDDAARSIDAGDGGQMTSATTPQSDPATTERRPT